MKKAVILLLVLGMGISMFGCKKQGGTSAGDKKTLEFWHIQTVDPAPRFIEDAVKRFEAANPDFKVNITVTANDSYKQKIAVAIAGNQMPDVFLSWSGGTTGEYVKAGKLTDLTSYMNANNYKNRLLDAAVAQATINGKIYGFPCENVAIEGVFYNKELFAKYNIAVPATIAELEAACDTFKANGITPFSLANMTKWTGMMYYQVLPARHAGLGPFAGAMDGSGSFDDPAFIWAAEKIQQWVKKGYFNEGFNGLDEDSGQSRILLYTDKCAMHMMGGWFASNVMGENPDYLKKLGFFNFPADERGTGDPKTITGTIGDNFYHVASTCKYPDKAFEMLTYLLDDTSVTERIAAGRIPPVKGINLTEPIMRDIFAVVQAAPDVQFWYDQSLVPEVADVMLSGSQEVFGLSVTPQEFARRWAAAQTAALKK